MSNLYFNWWTSSLIVYMCSRRGTHAFWNSSSETSRGMGSSQGRLASNGLVVNCNWSLQCHANLQKRELGIWTTCLHVLFNGKFKCSPLSSPIKVHNWSQDLFLFFKEKQRSPQALFIKNYGDAERSKNLNSWNELMRKWTGEWKREAKILRMK